MTASDPPDYLSGDLRICPSRGIVANAAGVEIRLGPVNMKVLLALVSRAEATIGRAEIYDGVWGNQVVGEDALTRCISDIRGELRKLSGRDDWIETVPKRGYRWAASASADTTERMPVDAPASGDVPSGGTAAAAAAASDTAVTSSPFVAVERRLLRLAGRGVVYLAALIVMASAIVWAIDRLPGPSVPVVAVLPVNADAGQLELAAQIDVEISAFLTGLDRVRVLSPSAIGARPSNPFPFFYYEFGARWLIEGELRSMEGHPLLTLTVADARTGLVELQVTQRILDRSLAGGGETPVALTDLGRFIDTVLAR